MYSQPFIPLAQAVQLTTFLCLIATTRHDFQLQLVHTYTEPQLVLVRRGSAEPKPVDDQLKSLFRKSAWTPSTAVPGSELYFDGTPMKIVNILPPVLLILF